MEEFKKKVQQYVDIEQNIQQHQAEIKKIKQIKVDLSNVIIEFMKQYKIDNCNLKNDILHLKTSSQLEPLNKDYINSRLKTFFEETTVKSKNHEELANTTTEYLLKNRESTEKFTLKIKKK
jgi:hypothetical protein